jgi:hypothetical protein
MHCYPQVIKNHFTYLRKDFGDHYASTLAVKVKPADVFDVVVCRNGLAGLAGTGAPDFVYYAALTHGPWYNREQAFKTGPCDSIEQALRELLNETMTRLAAFYQMKDA